MRSRIVQKKLRVYALLFCAFLLLSLFASYLYIGLSSGHICTDDHCVVRERLVFLSRLLCCTVLLSGSSLFKEVTEQTAGLNQAVSVYFLSRLPVDDKVRLFCQYPARCWVC